MAKTRNTPPRIRSLLRGGFNELQKDILEKMFNRLYKGEVLNVKEIRGLNDLTKMRYQEFIDFTGFNKAHLNDIVKQCPHIINSDGSYSPTNLLKYLRSAEYRKRSATNQEIINSKKTTETETNNNEDIDDRKRKTKLEADILEEKLSKLKETMIPKEEVEQGFNNRINKLLTYLDSTLDNELWKLENKNRFELKVLKDEIVKKAMQEYIGSFDIQTETFPQQLNLTGVEDRAKE